MLSGLLRLTTPANLMRFRYYYGYIYPKNIYNVYIYNNIYKINGPQGVLGAHLRAIEPQAPQALQHLSLEESDPAAVLLHDDGKGAVRSQDDVIYHAGVVGNLRPPNKLLRSFCRDGAVDSAGVGDRAAAAKWL